MRDADRMPADATVDAIAQQIVDNRIGGCFWRPLDPSISDWLAGFEGDVAMVDGSEPASVPRLLALCRRRHPDLPIVVVGTGVDRGAAEALFDGLSDPWPLIDRMSVLYCVTPDPCFTRLAAFAGRPIYCAEPDPEPVRVDPKPIVGLSVGDMSASWDYRSPYDRQAWALPQMLDYLAVWRVALDRTAGIGAFAGIARWKRRRVAQFFVGSPNAAFASDVAQAARQAGNKAIAVWPSRVDQAALDDASSTGGIWRIEDGFIRSAGLGAALVEPNSLVLDRRGIYYDPRAPSDLEHLLQSVEFPEALCDRARRLIDRIRHSGATKYNLPGETVPLPRDRHIILVAGQVADDQSVLTAGAGTTIAQILAVVRAENPDSYLIYKAHPDVAARLRQGEWKGESIATHADLILAGGDINDLLDRVDEVHVLSSLLGFEALLRGRRVVTHGQPFFAGWGLTEDRAPFAHRTRRLTLEELVAATLILYPLYVDPRSGLPCSVEHLLDSLPVAKLPSRTRMQLARVIEPLRKWSKWARR